MAPRLKSHIWVAALVRRAQIGLASAYVMRRGDPDAGTVWVKVAISMRESVLYRPIQNMDGLRVWLSKGPMEDRDIEAMITKQLKYDPDIWVIEIEDPKGRHFIEEPIEA